MSKNKGNQLFKDLEREYIKSLSARTCYKCGNKINNDYDFTSDEFPSIYCDDCRIELDKKR